MTLAATSIATSQRGLLIVHSSKIGRTETAVIELRKGASLPELMLPEIEVVLVIDGRIRWRRGKETRREWTSPHAFARRLDVEVALQAAEATTLLSLRLPTPDVFPDTEATFETAVWDLPTSAAHTARQLHGLLLARQAGDEMLLQGLAMAVTGWARTSAMRRPESGASPPWLSEVLRALDQAVATPTARQLGDVAGVGGSQLSRAFKVATGYSIGDFHRRLRVHRACRMMQDFHVPIATVAASCGFTDHAHFSRVFREVMSMSPSAYRSALNAPANTPRGKPRLTPVGRYTFSSRTTFGVPYDGVMVVTSGPDGLEGVIETAVMPDITTDSIVVIGDRLVITAKVPAGVAVFELRFRGAEFEGEWRLAGRATAVRGRRTG